MLLKAGVITSQALCTARLTGGRFPRCEEVVLVRRYGARYLISRRTRWVRNLRRMEECADER